MILSFFSKLISSFLSYLFLKDHSLKTRIEDADKDYLEIKRIVKDLEEKGLKIPNSFKPYSSKKSKK